MSKKLTTIGQLHITIEKISGFIGKVVETVAGAIEETEQKIPTKVSQLDNDSGYKTVDTTYDEATSSQAGLMSAADKAKLSGIESGANKYTHPTTAGYKHIPTGGASGQILRYSSSGTAVWGADRTNAVTVTIPTSGWKTDTSVADYPYYYEISVSSVTANDMASVIIAPKSQSAAMACGMCPTSETLSGKIRIRARSIPTESISAEYSTERRKGI